MNDHRGAPSEKLSLTRKQLCDMVWSTPMLRLARTFQCSSTWLARICRDAAVPVPPRGYWAKRRAGKAARRQPLPRSANPDEIVVSYTPQAETEEPAAKAPPPPPPPPRLDEDLQALRAQIEQIGAITVPADLDRLLPVVARTRRALRATDPERQQRHGLLQPRWVNDGCLLGLDVSATGIDRAIRLFERLFRAVLQIGGRILTKDKTPQIKMLGDCVRFYLRERPKMHRLAPEEKTDWWRGSIRWGGSGTFDLSISTDDELGFRRGWHDGRKGQLEDRLQEILLDMVDRIQDGRRWRLGAPARELERQRKVQELRQRELDHYRIQEERRLEAERVELLVDLAARYSKASQLRTFLAACKALPQRSAADDRWLAWSERVFDQLDPLAEGIPGIRATPKSYGRPPFAVFDDDATDGTATPPSV